MNDNKVNIPYIALIMLFSVYSNTLYAADSASSCTSTECSADGANMLSAILNKQKLPISSDGIVHLYTNSSGYKIDGMGDNNAPGFAVLKFHASSYDAVKMRGTENADAAAEEATVDEARKIINDPVNADGSHRVQSQMNVFRDIYLRVNKELVEKLACELTTSDGKCSSNPIYDQPMLLQIVSKVIEQGLVESVCVSLADESNASCAFVYPDGKIEYKSNNIYASKDVPPPLPQQDDPELNEEKAATESIIDAKCDDGQCPEGEPYGVPDANLQSKINDVGKPKTQMQDPVGSVHGEHNDE